MARFTLAVPVRALMALAAAGVASAQPAQTIMYGDPDDEATPLSRLVDASGVGLEAAHGAIAGDLARIAHSPHPTEDSLAMATEQTSGALRLRIRTEGAWGADSLVTADAGGGSDRGFDLAHEQSTGRVLIVYRRSGQNQVHYRIWDGSLSPESSVDLGFSSAPDRVTLTARPGSDELLLAASGGNTLRAAVWSGAAFGSVQTVEGSFTGTTGAWDAVASPGGAGWMVGWARSSDSNLRTRTWTSSGWSMTSTGPSAGGSISAVRMASAPDGSEVGALLQRGSNGSIHAARYTNAAWSSVTQIDGDATAGLIDLAYEGSGGALVAAWTEDDNDDLRYRRWSGSSWSGSTSTSAIGDDIAEVIAAPVDDAPAIVMLARCETTTGPVYGEYVAYTSEGNLDFGSGVTVNGDTGEDEPGVDLPDNPGGSHGSTNKSYSNGATASLAPGSYGTLSVGNGVTLNLSAGVYRFKESVSDKNGTTLACDTSGGDVTIIIGNGNFKAKNDLTIQRSGSGVVSFHVVNGHFTAGNGAEIDAMLTVHNWNIELGNNAEINGHLFAKSNIIVGNGGDLSLPGWTAPGGGGGSSQEAWAAVVEEGSADAPVELTTDEWEASTTLPLAVSRRVGGRPVRVLRWTEVPAFDN